MGGKSAKQKAQTGTCGYWPLAGLFANHPGYGLAPFFNPAIFGGCNFGCGGYGGYGGYGGISPLAFPFAGGYGGLPFGGYPYGNQTKGTVNLKDNCTGATLKLKW